MDHGVYVFFSDIYLNWDGHGKICEHYHKKMILPLMLSCKTLYKVYEKINKEYKCSVCYFRDVECSYCKLNGVNQCDICTCRRCGISPNLTGNWPLKADVCHGCDIGMTGWQNGGTGCYGETGPPGCCNCRHIGEESERAYKRAQQKVRRKLNKDKKFEYNARNKKNLKNIR
jgi:hypothetical protein